MTEGAEVHQTQPDRAGAAAATQSRTSSLQVLETNSGPAEMDSCESEEPDQREEESSTFPEAQHHSTAGPEDSSGGQVAPDGGWGWVVVAATILVLAMTLAFPSCIGIFYTDLQNDFQASNTETSWVPAIMMAVLHAGGREGSLILPIHAVRPRFVT